MQESEFKTAGKNLAGEINGKKPWTHIDLLISRHRLDRSIDMRCAHHDHALDLIQACSGIILQPQRASTLHPYLFLVAEPGLALVCKCRARRDRTGRVYIGD